MESPTVTHRLLLCSFVSSSSSSSPSAELRRDPDHFGVAAAVSVPLRTLRPCRFICSVMSDSRNSAEDDGKEAEPEQETAESEEFFESVDRTFTSSCSSASASEDDSAAVLAGRHLRAPRGGSGVGSFMSVAAASSSFDVWATFPASISFRRRRLLKQFSIAGDSFRSRLKSTRLAAADRGEGDGGTSLGLSSSAVGSDDVKVSSISKLSSTSNLEASAGDSGSAASAAPGVNTADPAGVAEDDGDEPRYSIKNLDTGREFTMKENHLREVSTGQQLTMEEFELCLGRSPIVQELMRRQSAKVSADNGGDGSSSARKGTFSAAASGTSSEKKKKSLFHKIRNVAQAVSGRVHHDDHRSSRDRRRDTTSVKGSWKSSSTTDDSQEGSSSRHHGPEKVKVRHNWTSSKEFTGLYMTQQVQAHVGPIWTIKFSSDGRYLASAGEDRLIHVWEVSQIDQKANLLRERSSEENSPFAMANGDSSLNPTLALTCAEGSYREKKKRWAKISGTGKSTSSEQLMLPEQVFSLSDKPVCSFSGHLEDVLDLSWSKSQHLLSSSMDKTVRLWNMSSTSCLKSFRHSDYVTCIQFNPVDDRYFISGSLDEKVRLWSIPDGQVVDWNEINDAVTAACYTPDGKGAFVGSHNGTCHSYGTYENKLLPKSPIDLINRKKKSSHKKITGFQFAPGSSSKVLVTSADSRIRVIDGVELVHRFKGFRNTSSQISAYCTSDGKYVICASEDSRVYIWKYKDDSQHNRSTAVADTHSYDHFYCQDVTVAVPWQRGSTEDISQASSDRESQPNSPFKIETQADRVSPSPTRRGFDIQIHGNNLSPKSNRSSDRGGSATWPEELMMTPRKESSRRNVKAVSRAAWGTVIVTAGGDGEIKVFQNFGLPI